MWVVTSSAFIVREVKKLPGEKLVLSLPDGCLMDLSWDVLLQLTVNLRSNLSIDARIFFLLSSGDESSPDEAFSAGNAVVLFYRKKIFCELSTLDRLRLAPPRLYFSASACWRFSCRNWKSQPLTL